MKRALAVAVALTLALFPAAPLAAQVAVFNMVPKSRSGETNQDSEPSITINPSNPLQLAAAAFTWDNLTAGPNMGDLAPIWVSTDGGLNWTLVRNIPSKAGSMFPTLDITLHFAATPSGTTNVLYGGIIFTGDSSMRVYSTPDYRLDGVAMTQLETQTSSVDQPHVSAATELRGSGAGNDRAYVGFNNNVGITPKTASVDLSTNAGVASPLFNVSLLESRVTGGQDGWAIVPAIHPDGTIYAIYYGWRTNFTPVKADVVVVRDDDWALAAPRFGALTEGGAGGAAGRAGRVSAVR